MVKDLFPYYIRAPNTGESKGILEGTVKDVIHELFMLICQEAMVKKRQGYLHPYGLLI